MADTVHSLPHTVPGMVSGFFGPLSCVLNALLGLVSQFLDLVDSLLKNSLVIRSLNCSYF